MQMEKQIKRQNYVYSETAYDDAFRTLEGKCDDLLIPFVNHMFGEHYDKTAVIRRLRNEHFVEHGDGSEDKRITDSHFEIIFKEMTKRYHLECESKPFSGEILVRIFEYGTQIAKDGVEKSSYKARFHFPNSGLLLLRSSYDTPSVASIEIKMPDGKELTYKMPIIKMADYSIEDIFREKMYMLIPFYIFNFEQKLSEINESEEETDSFVERYKVIFKRLDEELEKHNLSALSYDAIIRLTYSVAYKFTMNKDNVQRKVGDVMHGKVLDLPSFKVYEQGKEEGRLEGKAEGEKERNALKDENERLRLELEELKSQIVEK